MKIVKKKNPYAHLILASKLVYLLLAKQAVVAPIYMRFNCLVCDVIFCLQLCMHFYLISLKFLKASIKV